MPPTLPDSRRRWASAARSSGYVATTVGRRPAATSHGERIEAVAADAQEDAVEIDVAVDGELEVAGQVDDRGGVAAHADVRERRLQEAADEVDDRVELVTERRRGGGRGVGVGPVEPQLHAECLEPGAVVRPGRSCHPQAAPRGQLHEQVPDPTGRAVHEHPRSLGQPHPLQHLERGAAGQGQRSRRHGVQPGGRGPTRSAATTTRSASAPSRVPCTGSRPQIGSPEPATVPANS